MTIPAHPEDLLVVGWLNEGDQYPQFNPRKQVVSANATQRLFGKKFRYVFFTRAALTVPHSDRFFRELEYQLKRTGGELFLVDHYDEVSLVGEGVNL